MSEEKGCPMSRTRGSRSLSVRSFAQVTSVCLQLGRWIPLPVLLPAWGCVEQSGPVLGDTPMPPAPDPVPPLPSADQFAWQTQELTAFLHFGMDTFTNQEASDGGASPTLFNPTALDASQWMTTLQGAGFREAMLTAKHPEGFCLWPTKCTTYSVAASPWLGGQGDVVRQFVDAAHQANMRVGLALSPADVHDPTYGTPAYLYVFECELTELLTNYGAVDELWLWAEPPAPPGFDWNAIHTLAHELQPHTLVDVGNVATSVGADVRSLGEALAGPPGPTDQTSVQVIPDAGSPMPSWYPAEAVYSIRPGWFWHAAEDTQLKTLTQLVGLYYDSVGRNSVLRLNVPPNTQGLLADPDVAEVGEYGAALRGIYQTNLAEAQPVSADSVFRSLPQYAASMAVDGNVDTFWAAAEGTTSARIEVDFTTAVTFNLVSIQEPIALGERATQHHLEAMTNGVWATIATGTAIGERKLHRVGAVTTTGLALVITQARAAPAISELGIYESAFP
jgi:alpha-L-fucosidase